LGKFGAAAVDCLRALQTGLPLGTLVSEASSKEINFLVRRLAAYGLLEYSVGRPGADSLIVIEPQAPGYWPQTPELGDAGALVLSRFAYFRRRGDEMVLESPRAGALFKISDPALASFLAMLSAPQRIKDLRRHEGFPGVELLALLVDCHILLKTDADGEGGLRSAEGDHDLALWDFHDLLFHTRSTEGRHANPVGGTYPHEGAIPPLPAVRPSWPGSKIDLCAFLDTRAEALPPFVKLLRERHSTRSFDNGQPITLAELSHFLDGAARIMPQRGAVISSDVDPVEHARPYPSAGGSWELELYLTVNICQGLPQGFYHYDAAAHALVPIEVPANELKALLMGAADAMAVETAPQVLITIAARFGRVSWKYSSIAYSLILRDVGVLTQTLYLMATEMGLGGCAIGIANIDRFAKMTGIEFHAEGPVGQFAIGRPAASGASD
jgi:SagB-type dehydrogenase family enzyme